MRSLIDAVNQVRVSTDRRATMNALIGPRSDDTHVLHWRALFITACRAADVWPPTPRA